MNVITDLTHLRQPETETKPVTDSVTPSQPLTIMSTSVTLWLAVSGNTELALSIPITKCEELALNPLKWLRFLGFIISGQEGYLSLSDAGPDIGNYTIGIEPQAYYFISQGEL